MLESVHSMARLLPPPLHLLPYIPPVSHPQGALRWAGSVLRRWAGALCGGEDLCRSDWDWSLGSAGGWVVGLDLGLELGHLLRASQSFEQVVLLLKLSVSLDQLFDLLLQHLHLLAHSVHQVALHQVLRRRERKRWLDKYFIRLLLPCVPWEKKTSCSNHMNISDSTRHYYATETPSVTSLNFYYFK